MGGAGATGKSEFDERQAAAGRFEQGEGAITILHTSRMNEQFEHPAIGVHRGVPLAAFDLLPCVIAVRAA